MTYEEVAALQNDMVFRGRVKVAAIKYADSIVIEPGSTPAHTSRLKWSNLCYQAPDQQAMQIQQFVVWDPSVQAAGSAVTDAELQGAVEATINKEVI